MKRVLWSVLTIVLLIVSFGFAVPHFAADRFGAGAQRALEVSLGRKVKIGRVQFNLFTGPGFSISDIVIYDDPALSPEPILYASTLTAIPRIWPLFAGHLAFSSIRLEDARINLGRTASPDQPARWNVGALTQPALFQAFPNITVVSGGVRGIAKSRINFRIGNVKTPFYILIDRLEVRPPSSANGPWGIRLEGEPARTDRPAIGFGSFIADGRWSPAQGLADISVRLERSEISDMIALLNGHDAGIHGLVAGMARAVGPLSALKINGRLEMSGIHGWDQLGSASQNWPLAIAGIWNLPAQLFELSARVAGTPDSPVQAHFRVSDYLGAPHWGFGLTCQAMPLQPLIPLARQIGLPIPDAVQLDGTLDGAVSFSRSGAMEGSAGIRKASLTVSGEAPLEFEDAQLMIADGHAKLAPSTIRVSDSDEGTIQGDYDLNERALEVTVVSRGMDISALRHHARVAGVPVLRDLRSGVWKGHISYGSKRTWTGSMDLQHAIVVLPMLAAPLRIASAHADFDAKSLIVRKIQASSGDVEVRGDYRYEAGVTGVHQFPHRFHLTANTISGTQIESLFRPVLSRGGLVSRLGLTRVGVPEWLAQTRADGIIDVETVDLGGAAFDHVSSRLIWDGAHVRFAGAKARFDGGNVSAEVEADFTGNVPSYHAVGDATDLTWKAGKINADMSVDTSGLGMDALANFRAEGSFNARDVDPEYVSIGGCFQFAWGGKSPRVKLSSLQVSDGEEIFVGAGSTTAGGELVLDLAGVTKPVRLTLR